MTDEQLESWARSHAEGPSVFPVAVAVLRVLDEKATLRDLNKRVTALVIGLADRVAAQSELLSKRAEGNGTSNRD